VLRAAARHGPGTHEVARGQSVPRALQDAALIDESTWSQLLLNVLLPAAMPGLVAAAMLTFMIAWNDYRLRGDGWLRDGRDDRADTMAFGGTMAFGTAAVVGAFIGLSSMKRHRCQVLERSYDERA